MKIEGVLLKILERRVILKIFFWGEEIDLENIPARISLERVI